MNISDWGAKVNEACDRTEFMAIATTDEGEPWTNPVQFGYDEHLNLFFISKMDAKHTQNILKNGKVSGAIYKTERFPGARRDVLGLQFSGHARLLTERQEIFEAARHYYGRDPRRLDYKTRAEEHIKDGTWHFFRIVLTELWCFDSRVREKRVHIPLESLRVELKY